MPYGHAAMRIVIALSLSAAFGQAYAVGPAYMKTTAYMKTNSLVTLIFLVASCGSDSSDGPPLAEHKFLFGMRFDSTGAQDVVGVTSKPEVLSKARQELEKPVSQRALFISGAIDRGNSGNRNWNWHFKLNEWDLVEGSVELCDGRPSYVEQNIDYWVDTVHRFCPWASFVKREITDNDEEAPEVKRTSNPADPCFSAVKLFVECPFSRDLTSQADGLSFGRLLPDAYSTDVHGRVADPRFRR